MNGHTVTGHLTGSARETEEAMEFAVTNNVRPMIERMPLEQAGEAVTRLRSGAPRFRILLDTAGGNATPGRRPDGSAQCGRATRLLPMVRHARGRPGERSRPEVSSRPK
ncbi:hypothetical protein [Streptomyces sp. NPDC002573]|uniref:hypothetical protein n=1 Tax=Streptomyces sp. NPDC002573 TaxID=3364651 RepID=UPI00369E8C2D